MSFMHFTKQFGNLATIDIYNKTNIQVAIKKKKPVSVHR